MANSTTIRERGSDGIEFTAAIPASQPGDVFPAGVMLHFAGASPPAGWLICDGTVVSRATYPNLFTAIGILYGAGDGSTTFGLPDTRGKVPVGKHSSGTFTTLGAVGGTETHQLTAAQMPSHIHGNSHTHTYSGNTGGRSAAHTHGMSQNIIPTRQGTQAGNVVSVIGAAGSYTDGVSMNTESADHTHAFSGTTSDASANTGSAGSDNSHNNLQPYIVLNHIIRAY